MDLEAASLAIQKAKPEPADLTKLIHNSNIPEICFELALCDCAETLLEEEELAERAPEPASWAAIRAKRLWLQGQLTEEKMAEAQEGAMHALRYTEGLPWVGRQLISHADEAFAQGIQRFLHSSSRRISAAIVAQRAAWFQVSQSPLGPGRNAFYNLVNHETAEASWLASLQKSLLHWVERHSALQKQILNVLLHRLHVLEHRAKSWKSSLEEPLF